MSAQHTHHINVRETQLEMPERAPGAPSALSDDFEGKLGEAQKQLELLQQHQEEIERRKRDLQELHTRKQEFLTGQVGMTEKLSFALTSIERELFEMRQEVEDLDQTRGVFAKNLERLNHLNPDQWGPDVLGQELNKSISLIDQAEEEYDQAVQHFSGGRSRGIFGVTGKKKNQSLGSSGNGEFSTMLKNGFAFNLPVIVFGSIAVLVYLIK